MVIERYKSGYDPPSDIPFEDLSRMDSTPAPPSQPISALKPEYFTVKGTMSVGKSWKRPGIFAIFSSNKVRHCRALRWPKSVFHCNQTWYLKNYQNIWYESVYLFLFWVSMPEAFFKRKKLFKRWRTIWCDPWGWNPHLLLVRRKQ